MKSHKFLLNIMSSPDEGKDSDKKKCQKMKRRIVKSWFSAEKSCKHSESEFEL